MGYLDPKIVGITGVISIEKVQGILDTEQEIGNTALESTLS